MGAPGGGRPRDPRVGGLKDRWILGASDLHGLLRVSRPRLRHGDLDRLQGVTFNQGCLVLVLSVLSNTAFALNCAGLNVDSCNAANDAAAHVNAATGQNTVSDGAAKANRRISYIYDQFEAVRAASMCPAGTVVGSVGGEYRAGNIGQFTGTFDSDGPSGTLVGTIDLPNNTFDGTYSPDIVASGTGTFTGNGQLFHTRAGGFVGGIWVRTTGSRG